MGTSNGRHGIRFLITAITVLFTLVLSIAFGSACFYLFRGYARSSVLRAAESNLQQVVHLVQQDLVELNSMASQQALDPELADYLSGRQPTRRQALDVYDDMTAMVNRSRWYLYLQRFIATDGGSRIIQVSHSITNATPLTSQNLSLLPGIDTEKESVWQQAFHDPFLADAAPDSLLVVRPVFQPRSTKRIGTVYLTASSELITDRLASYEPSEGALFYLQTESGVWRVEEGRLVPDDGFAAASIHQEGPVSRADGIQIREIDAPDGGSYTLVTCPVGNFGVSLSHCIPASAFFAQQTVLWAMIGCMVLLVLIMGLILFLYLNRLIVQPVAKLRSRIGRISGGDFSADPSIEWPNELGDVGRGVNQLSKDIQELMERRLADEKERQDLEYKMLQNQINPHFIYNTLNSIKWMATIQGASGIAEMTTSFARLLKSVSKGNQGLNTLRQEFALLSDYCTIQQYRYGGAITIEIADISDEQLCECLIPSFSLQPLAENAIFHGIEPKGGVGSIWLYIRQDADGDVVIIMEDDGVGMSREAIDAVFQGEDAPRSGAYRQIGVRNVHRRIQYAFGPQYGLSIQSSPGEYTRVEIRIPFRPRGGISGKEQP